MIPLFDPMAVSGGISSVDKAITLGFHCDGDTVSSPDLFIDGIDQALALLRGLMNDKPKQRARAKAKAKAKSKTKAKAKKTVSPG